MPSQTYLLQVLWFASFTQEVGAPPVVEGLHYWVLCPPLPLLDGLKPGTPVELRLGGEPEGGGRTCIFLSYAPDLWNREVGTIIRFPIEWPLPGTDVPHVEAQLSLSIPQRKKPAVRQRFIRNILNDNNYSVRGNFRGDCKPERW